MCNCIEEVEQRMLVHMQEYFPDRKYETELPYRSTKIGIRNPKALVNSRIVLIMEMGLRYTTTKKSGAQSAPKTHLFNIHPTFCCFCGDKIDYGD